MKGPMKRDRVLEQTRDGLAKTGFFLSQPHGERGLCFDLVARRDDTLLIVKVLQNVDALNRETARELMRVSRILEGSPLVVGQRSGTGTLEDGVIYTRFGVPILSRRTLAEFLEEGVPPFLYSAPGGLYVRLDSDALRRLREERQVSLGTLADMAGVTRRTIQMYLEGMSATMEVAMRLEEFLHESLVLPADPFALLGGPAEGDVRLPRLEGFERELFQRLERLGYRVVRTVRSPFDALSQYDETTLLTGFGDADRALERKAEVVSNLGRVVEKDSVMFVERRAVRRKSIRGVPVIGREELRRAKDRDDVEEMISERKG
jgi:putative transcriptional regulator